jgi:hypothetical protein
MRASEREARLRKPMLAAAAIAALLLQGAAATTASAAPACRPAKAKPMARSELLVVTERPNGVLQVCYRPTRHVTPIDSDLSRFDGNPIADAAVTATRGSLVAYEWVSSDARQGATKRVRVLDARRGVVVTDVRDAYSGSNWQAESIAGRFLALELRSDGAIAWITPLPAGPQLEVRWAARGARSSSLLASSTEIAEDSLALGRRFVYWQQAGVASSFAIPTHRPSAYP